MNIHIKDHKFLYRHINVLKDEHYKLQILDRTIHFTMINKSQQTIFCK